MIAFSREGSLLKRASSLFGSVAMGLAQKSQLSSTERSYSVSQTMTDRSMTFCNSRMFPRPRVGLQ